jgi:hypothetical protein
MARYFFDLHDGKGTSSDREGAECADAQAVSALTTKILSEIVSKEVKLDGQMNFFVSVRDEVGRIAHVATLTLTNKWLTASKIASSDGALDSAS